MARRTKLTPERQALILDLITAGNYAKTACLSARISEETYYSWLNRGRKDRSESRKTLFSEFLESVEMAEAKAEADMVVLIKNAAVNGNVQAAQWYLERKHSDKWGRNDKLRQEVSGSVGLIDVSVAKKEVLAFLASRKDDDEITEEQPA